MYKQILINLYTYIKNINTHKIIIINKYFIIISVIKL